jgi:hypothetical protein
MILRGLSELADNERFLKYKVVSGIKILKASLYTILKVAFITGTTGIILIESAFPGSIMDPR